MLFLALRLVLRSRLRPSVQAEAARFDSLAAIFANPSGLSAQLPRSRADRDVAPESPKSCTEGLNLCLVCQDIFIYFGRPFTLSTATLNYVKLTSKSEVYGARRTSKRLLLQSFIAFRQKYLFKAEGLINSRAWSFLKSLACGFLGCDVENKNQS